MARPAGYSSDEDLSDDGLSFGSDLGPIKRNYIHKVEDLDHVIEKEEKFVTAVIYGEIEKIKRYIKEGVEINYKSPKHGNWSALMHACSLGKVEIIKYLLDNGANINEHHELLTPLLCLCDSSNKNEEELVASLDLLVDYGADVNALDWFKTNALVYAIKKCHRKLVLKLLNIGCNKDTSDSGGWTPIFYAVDRGDLEIVQILKDAGANLKKIDHRGRNLQDIAITNQHKEIAEILNVTGKQVDVDDIIYSSKEYTRMSNYEYVMSDLPNRSNGRLYGFHQSAVRWVYGLGLSSLVKLLVEKNVQLNELLTMDEEDFEKLGITLSYDRKKMKYCVQKLHEHSWGKNCLIDPSEEEEMNLNIAAQLLCNIIRQVHICSASTYFWRNNIDKQDISDKAKTYIEKGLYYIKFMKREKDIMLRLIKEIEEQDEIVPSDLILPKETKPYSKLKIILTIAFSFLILKTLKPNLIAFKSRIIT